MGRGGGAYYLQINPPSPEKRGVCKHELVGEGRRNSWASPGPATPIVEAIWSRVSPPSPEVMKTWRESFELPADGRRRTDGAVVSRPAPPEENASGVWCLASSPNPTGFGRFCRALPGQKPLPNSPPVFRCVLAGPENNVPTVH
jgi:hypothetical protein